MWQTDFIENLKKRDDVEKQYEEWIDVFQKASKRAVLAEMGVKSDISPDQEKELADLYSDLAIKTDKLDKLGDDFKKLNIHHEKLLQEAKSSKIKVSTYREETQLKSQTVQHLHDEILALQIEVNALYNKIEGLEAENVALVDRWMAKVAGEVDQMNEANAIIQNSKRENI